tara:strand:- start:2792 stop:3238 length:447 start_codon:yes stop_codon:yes gene_type:complete
MELKQIDKTIQDFQDLIVNNNNMEGLYGDGKSIAEIPDIPIKHSFADQLYVRQMDMKAGQVVIGAIHNHQHVWFLLTGKVIINNNGEKIEHIAPCYTVSEPGSKRLIYAVEDSIFVNVHKNPSNTKNIKKLEETIVSFTREEYNNKNK